MNMLWAAYKNGIKRFVYASLSSVYGDSSEVSIVKGKIEERRL